MRIFLDTEFLSIPTGFIFLSMGLITDAGHRFYSEVPLARAKALLAMHPNDFVRDKVLVQFNRLDSVPWSELPTRLAIWLDRLGPIELEVIYDYSVDYLLIEQLLERVAQPLRVSLQPAHVGYLLDDVDGAVAASACWLAIEATFGIGQHHAMADALALRARFEAVHCRP